jgi:hypothetical protein
VATTKTTGGPPQLAQHVGEQDRRRLVRPLQVIEYQQEAAWSGGLGQPSAPLGEQREPLGAARAGAADQIRALGVTEHSRPQAGMGRVVVSGPDGVNVDTSTSRPRPARASSRRSVTRARSRSRPTTLWALSPSTAPP